MPSKRGIFILYDIDAFSVFSNTYLERNQTDNVTKEKAPHGIALQVSSPTIKMQTHLSVYQNGLYLPLQSNIPCWWCHCSFSTLPLGCPTRYIPDGDPVVLGTFKELNLSTRYGTDIFETEGIFCSLSCIAAYILDSPSNMYSQTLLTLLAYKLTGTQYVKPSPDWRLHEHNGGPKSHEQFFDTRQRHYSLPSLRRPLMFVSGKRIVSYTPREMLDYTEEE